VTNFIIRPTHPIVHIIIHFGGEDIPGCGAEGVAPRGKTKVGCRNGNRFLGQAGGAVRDFAAVVLVAGVELYLLQEVSTFYH